MPFRRLALSTLLLTGVLLSACSLAPTPVTKPPAANTGAQQRPKNLELVAPVEGALVSLKRMNETGRQGDFTAAETHFREFRLHWAVVRAKLQVIDPKLAVHLEDGAVELDLEFTKPRDQIRVYELDEETVKLGRLLSEGAELLNVPISPELVQRAPAEDIPFNQTQRIVVTLTDHRIDPKVIEVEQHTQVTFVIVNGGKEVHEFELGHYAVEAADIKPGETRELTVVTIDAGEYETACHQPGHYEVGMTGSLKVKPAELKQR